MTTKALTKKRATRIAPANQAVTPADLLKIAVSQQDVDLDKLEKLMDLQERWQANEAKKSYIAALANFQSECPPIYKTKDAHNSKYTPLAEIMEIIKDALHDNGLAVSWNTKQQDGMVLVTCRVTHIDGHSEETSMVAEPDTSGSKNKIQSIGSTQSYLMRYTMSALLSLSTLAPEDTDGNTNFHISDTQAADLQSALDEVGGDRTKFLNYFKVKSFEELPESKYGEALRRIEQKRKAQ